MAREEHDREDLLREATALVERIELFLPQTEGTVVAGFRAHGAASVFFGSDPVYQFNAALELRRAFVDGKLLKAEHGKLIALERRRSREAVLLARDELASAEANKLLRAIGKSLRNLEATLRAGEYRLVGQVPAQSNVLLRLLEWLRTMPELIRIAERPNVA